MNLFSTHKKAPTLFWCMIIAIITVMTFPADALAQRGRSGGGSRISRPSSISRSQNRSRTNRSAKPSQNNNKTWGNSRNKSSSKASSSKTTSSKSKQTSADKALYNKAKKQGTHFKSRKQATAAFATTKGPELRSKNPVRFDSKPTSRPSYIPQTYSTGGNTYNISYNPGYGGYGYMNSLGTWVMYDIMWNQSFVNNQMRNYGYAYGPAPSNNAGAVMAVGMIIGVVVIGGIIFVVIASNNSESRAA